MMKTTVLSTLTALALTTTAVAQSISGTYLSEGRNADGSAYTGTATITETSGQVGMQWTVGAQNYAGAGQFDGRILSVNWGAPYPVIYILMTDGTLHGTWDNGRALEKLTPR